MSDTPFFIVGSPRSGTTLLVQILNRHRNLFVPPETHFFSFVSEFMARRRIPEREAGSASVLPDLVAEYMQRPFYDNLNIAEPEMRGVLLRDASCYGDVFDNLMQHLTRQSGKRRWGEKTPKHLHHAPLILDRYPQAQFILLIRDGRAAIRSHFTVPHWNDNWYGFTREWSESADSCLELVQSMPESRLLAIRYEDLVGAPEESVRAACRFLGEDYSSELIKADDAYSRNFKVYERDWMKKSAQAVDATRALAWEQDYRPSELKLVEVLAGDRLAKLGYELRNPRSFSWVLLLTREYMRHQLHRVRRKLFRRREAGA